MKRIVLFSTPTDTNIDAVLTAIMPEGVTKTLGYVPSDGANSPPKYALAWQRWVESRDWSFRVINNSQAGAAAATECAKFDQCGVILISGGNTYTLLRNLRRSGLDQAIRNFAKRPQFVLAGFSAGAIVLTPTIAIAGISDDYDENAVGLTDLTGLNLVDFEVFPHFADQYEQDLEHYRLVTANKISTITDEEIMVINQ